MDPRLINLFRLALKLPLQRNSQSQAGIKVLIAGGYPQTRGYQGVIHYRPLIAKDPAIIYKGKSIPDLFFIYRRLPGKAGAEALVAAQTVEEHSTETANAEETSQRLVAEDSADIFNIMNHPFKQIYYFAVLPILISPGFAFRTGTISRELL